MNSEPSWFGFPLVVKDQCPANRDEIVKFLNDRKIGTRLLFAGNLTKQPYMKAEKYRTVGELTNTDLIMKNTFWVGVYPALDERHLDYIAASIEEVLGIGF